VFTGFESGWANTTGKYNTYAGNSNGFFNTTGSYNVGISIAAGQGLDGGTNTGYSNTFAESFSGFVNTTGYYMWAMGPAPTTRPAIATPRWAYSAAPASTTRTSPMPRPWAPLSSLTQSNTVVLGNNANVGIGTSNPSQKLDVVGNINASGEVRANGVVLTSDQCFKQNVRPLRSALASVLALRGVRYEWNALGIKHGGKAGAG
jgi:hypothetical protein